MFCGRKGINGLGSNIISGEYITVMLVFCNHCIFSHAFAYTSFSEPSSIRKVGVANDEERATNKPEILGPVEENSATGT